MTRMEERMISVEKEIDEMRQAFARLSSELNSILNTVSRQSADVVELQQALKQVKEIAATANKVVNESHITRYE